MAFPPGPWVRVVTNFGNSEKTWENVFWYKLTGSIPPTINVQAVATDVEAALMGPFTAIMSSEAYWNGVDVYLNNGTYTVAGHTYTSTQGVSSGNQLPTEDAAIVTLNSAIGTREGVGRIYIGGLSQNFVDESKMNSGGYTALTAISTAMKGLGTFDGASGYLAVWSRKGGTIDGVNFVEPRALLGHRTKRRPRR